MSTFIKTAKYAECSQVTSGSSSIQSFLNPEKKVGSPTEDDQSLYFSEEVSKGVEFPRSTLYRPLHSLSHLSWLSNHNLWMYNK